MGSVETPEVEIKPINKVLRLFRKENQLTLSELAQKLGFSDTYIGDIENGHREVSRLILDAYSDFFGIPRSYFELCAENNITEKDQWHMYHILEKEFKKMQKRVHSEVSRISRT